MWHEYFTVTSTDEAAQLLAEKGESARIIAGATDLMLELERGVRKGVNTLIDITRVPGLNRISLDQDNILHLGPLVTHNTAASSEMIRTHAYPLARAAWEVGAPQIRNRGTIAGNLITASPANDTITPLMAMGGSVTLQSVRGQRIIPLADFYTGVRRNVMQADEVLVDISLPVMTKAKRGAFIKIALRRAQAISIVNAAVVLEFAGDEVVSAAITLGAVAPTIIHAPDAEAYLAGRKLDEDVISRAAQLAMDASRPIDDIRGSAAYRREMVRISVLRGLRSVRDSKERDGFPNKPILLATDLHTGVSPKTIRHPGQAIETTVNGRRVVFENGHAKSLLRLLREEGLLTGTKEGCAEGECGACTIFMDGMAVMACLVPAPRAHGAEIITVEGLANGESLHPIQEAFIQKGAVQCGYCSPGFLMSAAKLLEEEPQPSRSQIQEALTGNLCRCTGYYKIIEAVEAASRTR